VDPKKNEAKEKKAKNDVNTYMEENVCKKKEA
jgi:hypothetical protein